MTPGPIADAVFHLHPLRRCNLACGHCYSNSTPRATDMLAFEPVAMAIRQAAAWGYTRLAISGGEPLLYPWLSEVVALAAECGMRTALITNGLLVAQKDNLAILRRIDTVAVSIDGLGVAHDRLRQRARAFADVLRALALLADAGIDFHIICGVSSDNLATAYQGRMGVHTDLVHRSYVIAQPSLIYAAADSEARHDARPADLLGVLVLEPDGVVNPVSYGFGSLFTLGNLLEQPLESMWAPWLDAGYCKLSHLGRKLLTDLLAGSGAAVFNPSDVLRHASYQIASRCMR